MPTMRMSMGEQKSSESSGHNAIVSFRDDTEAVRQVAQARAEQVAQTIRSQDAEIQRKVM